MDALTELLANAMHEIRELRRRNELLSAKVEMVDLFACVLHRQPASRSQGATVDVAWLLQKKIDEIEQSARAVSDAPVNPMERRTFVAELASRQEEIDRLRSILAAAQGG